MSPTEQWQKTLAQVFCPICNISRTHPKPRKMVGVSDGAVVVGIGTSNRKQKMEQLSCGEEETYPIEERFCLGKHGDEE